jgi:F-type H+-transporting ATPase subunit b
VPQFDSAYWLPQLVWLAAIFAVLYFAVVRPTLPKVGRIIDEREGRVSGDLDAAVAAKGEADSIRTRYDAGMSAARDAAQARVAAAQADAAKAAEGRMKALAEVLDGKAAAAAARLDTARNGARASLAATTTELTAEAVMRLTGLTLPAAEIDAVLSAQK